MDFKHYLKYFLTFSTMDFYKETGNYQRLIFKQQNLNPTFSTLPAGAYFYGTKFSGKLGLERSVR